ncbi:uncharacterized protein LOC142345556 [Convolutriloba macropyga]|uniref:uncharacterized protein LOC142345556 n=1 Tax=Convolutriloba macropyga TaxID=536237 RepID=UPI003F51E821
MDEPSSTSDDHGTGSSVEDVLGLFTVKLPGDNELVEINLTDNKTLLKFVESQYPDWKKEGSVTLVPEVRIPKLFLYSTTLPERVKREHYSPVKKGEEAELKVYRALKQLAGNEKGFLVFPNVDGHKMFIKQKSEELNVENDTVVVHPTKGVFIFNVKDASAKHGASKENIFDDMERHSTFIHTLMTVGIDEQTKTESDVPIHGVICLFNAKKLPQWVKKAEEKENWFSKDSRSRVIGFHKSDFENFESKFSPKLREIPEMEVTKKLDILASRLIALNSMESSVALVHQKIASDMMQSTMRTEEKATKFIRKQVEGLELSDDQLKAYQNNFVISKTSGKIQVILWTKEQLDIIAKSIKAIDPEYAPDDDT